jgi:hypothetical protein
VLHKNVPYITVEYKQDQHWQCQLQAMSLWINLSSACKANKLQLSIAVWDIGRLAVTATGTSRVHRGVVCAGFLNHIVQSVTECSNSLVNSSPAKRTVRYVRRTGHTATHVATPAKGWMVMHFLGCQHSKGRACRERCLSTSICGDD